MKGIHVCTYLKSVIFYLYLDNWSNINLILVLFFHLTPYFKLFTDACSHPTSTYWSPINAQEFKNAHCTMCMGTHDSIVSFRILGIQTTYFSRSSFVHSACGHPCSLDAFTHFIILLFVSHVHDWIIWKIIYN